MSRSSSRHPHDKGLPITPETLSQLPAFVATVVSDYATGNVEQGWQWRKHTLDMDALDDLPCATRSTCELWVQGARGWLRRSRNGKLSLCPVSPLPTACSFDEQLWPDVFAWIVERTWTASAHIIVWQIAAMRSESELEKGN